MRYFYRKIAKIAQRWGICPQKPPLPSEAGGLYLKVSPPDSQWSPAAGGSASRPPPPPLRNPGYATVQVQLKFAFRIRPLGLEIDSEKVETNRYSIKEE